MPTLRRSSRQQVEEEQQTVHCAGPTTTPELPPQAAQEPSASVHSAAEEFVNKKVKHVSLGLGIVRKFRDGGKILFEWERAESVGGRSRKRKQVKYNRWVKISEVELLDVAEGGVPELAAVTTASCTPTAGRQTHQTPTASRVEAAQQQPPASELSPCEEDDGQPSTLDHLLRGLGDKPKEATLYRERQTKERSQIASNPHSIGGRWRSKTVQHIPAASLIKGHFENNFLVADPVSKNAVFCRACKKNYPLIKSSLSAHISSAKHKQAVLNLTERTSDDKMLKEFLEDYFNQNPQAEGATLSTDVQVYRFRVVESLIRNGIPMAKVDGLRPILERSGIALTDSSHMASLITRVFERECALLKKEIDKKFVTFIFDGTSRLGEAVNVVYRYCEPDFSGIMHRLVNFTTVERHMDGDELARHLLEVLTNKMQVPYKHIVGSARDSCATNGAGLRVIKPLFPAMMDSLCYSHMLQGTGSRFVLQSLDAFLTPFLTVHKMAVVKSLWKEIVGKSMKGYSKTRWWSRWDMLCDIAAAFGPTLDAFVQALCDKGIAEESSSKMQAALQDESERANFELELAIIMDCQAFKIVTYALEGDGLCVLRAYDKVEELRKFGRQLSSQNSLPNTAALLRARVKLEAGVKVRQFWSETDAPGQSGWWEGIILNKRPGHGQACAVRYSNGDEMWILKSEEKVFRGSILAHELEAWQEVMSKVRPAFEYVENRLNDNCDTPYHMRLQHMQMRALKVFDPFAAKRESLAGDSFVDGLADIPAFVKHNLIPGMKEELNKYTSEIEKINVEDEPLDMGEFTSKVLKFWAHNNLKFKTWATAAQIAFSLSPNSAACERVFSLLSCFYGANRQATLADEISASLMLAYNKRNVG